MKDVDDNIRGLQAAIYETRRSSGDAILYLIRLREEVSIHRRVLAKLTAVCPELVEAAMMEVQLEDVRSDDA